MLLPYQFNRVLLLTGVQWITNGSHF